MARCARCCVHSSMRAMNVIVNLCGVGMIIYSLWLEKMWDEGVALLPTVANLPRPWFIYTCLGVGIAVCLSTVLGYSVANCIGNSSLCIYIITLLSLLFLEATVLVLIFFKMDWAKLISEYIDNQHEKFKSFVVFHLKMCRLIVLLILMLQIIVIVFAVILWVIGTGPRTDQTRDVRSLRQSFLVWPNSPAPLENSQTCRRCGELNDEPIDLQKAHAPQQRFRSSTGGGGRSVHSNADEDGTLEISFTVIPPQNRGHLWRAILILIHVSESKKRGSHKPQTHRLGTSTTS